MPLYTLTREAMVPVPETSFGAAGILERQDLQRLLLENIDIVSPETLVIAEEFSSWDESTRRIDLLGVQKGANLVVIELKRDDTGAHMELQAIRYAAMVARMTFQQAVSTYDAFLRSRKSSVDARNSLLGFLGWDEPNEAMFAQDVRIVLVAADFSRELTTSVMWLNERELNIRCVQLRPYILGSQLLVNAEQVIPLPEATDYQVQVHEKARKERAAAAAPMARYDLEVNDEHYTRLWKRELVYHAIHDVVTMLRRHPEEISTVVRHSRLWASAEGKLDTHQISEAIRSQGLDPRRFFVDDDELFHVDGRTYALTNQWGLNTLDAMEALRAAFPDLRIQYRESEA